MLADALKGLLADAEALVANFKTALLVALLVALTFWVTRCEARKEAVTAERVTTLTHEIKVATPVYVHDTVVAYHTRTHYDTARVRDTVVRNDSVFVYRPAADTAINACTAALHDCDRIRLLNDSLTTQLGKQKKSWKDRIGVSVGPSIVATRDGTVVWGVGAVIGVRVWP